MIEPKDLPALSREELLALVLVVNSWWLSSRTGKVQRRGGCLPRPLQRFVRRLVTPLV
jgi:hypothetical protein